MDQSTRHWYLQQMGIPVWVPKQAEKIAADAGVAEAAVEESGEAAQPNPAVHAETTQPQADRARDIESPESAPESTPPPSVEAPQQPNPSDQTLNDEPQGSSVAAASIWLVMPNIATTQQAAAEALLDKILAAVDVPKASCQLIWGLPEAMPAADVKWVWCFGLQPPPGLQASTLILPPLTEMLSNVEAKKQAWGLLKNQMPFL